jgi:Fe-S cluster assembly protein SufD
VTALDTQDRATHAREAYLADYEALQKNGVEPVWLRDLRRHGIARFGELSFPTIHDEDWKYTSVAPIVNLPFHSSPTIVDGQAASEIARRAVPGGGQQLVFVNGRYAADLSDPPRDGVTMGALSSLPDSGGRLAERHLGSYLPYDRVAFSALNAALSTDVARVQVPKGRALAEPIYLTFVSISDDDLIASHPRVLIILDEAAEATVIETYVGAADHRYFTNAVTEIALGDGARIEHCKLVQESERAFHVGTTQVHEGRDSSLTSVAITTGGALVRNDLNVVLDAEGASCALYGLYVTGDGQHVDNHTAIEHAKPHGTSRQLYKGILDGKSRAVFNGKVIVHRDAQKTDAQQTNRNLLLSGDATVDTKPQLEIFADDVKCTHGAAIGRLDPEALFYLRSRAMSEQTARSLLTYAFASEVVERISVAPLREQLDAQLRSILRQGW